MIDWVDVGLNSLWILGLASILAAFSYHHWLASESARRLRDVLSQPSWKVPLFAGMLLTCVGVGYGLTERWWEKAVWTVLAASFAWQLVMVFRQMRRKADR